MNCLRVLMFHKVSENYSDFLTVTVSQLFERLNWIRQRNTFITLRDLTEHIESGKQLPHNAVLITFDDGYENNYKLAYPVFKELNIPFSIFMVSSFIGKKINYDHSVQQFLNIEQLHHMQDLVQYGFHSYNHLNLLDLDEKEWADEIGKGVETLKAYPIPVESAWAYTYGGFPKNKNQFEHLANIFRTKNVSCAFRIGNRVNRLPINNTYAIQRIDVRGNHGLMKFKWKFRFGKFI